MGRPGANDRDEFDVADALIEYQAASYKVKLNLNNLFDKDPPGCITCNLNNFDPNAYDVPGRFFYLRLSYRQ